MKSSPFIKIENKIISYKSKPFTVAEVGINHNGKIELAYKMIDVAANAGCDAVKFQTFKAKEFIRDRSLKFTYQSQGKKVTESMMDMFERYELPKSAWKKIKFYCRKRKIIFLSTPQNYSDLKILLKIGIKAIKVGSDDFNNISLIKKYSETKLPLILSTGMADFDDVKNAVKAVCKNRYYPLILLVCTSEYPTEPSNVNLKKIATLKNLFPKILIGYSDHTRGFLASSLAVSFGACIFEKHFTLNNNFPGPDHWFSENPKTLKDWVKHIHIAHKMLGSGVIKPTKNEAKSKKEFRRVLVAAKNLKKGHAFRENDFNALRVQSKFGLPISRAIEFIGKIANKDYKKNELIRKK